MVQVPYSQRPQFPTPGDGIKAMTARGCLLFAMKRIAKWLVFGCDAAKASQISIVVTAANMDP